MTSELEEEKLQPKRAREVIAGEGAQVLDLRDDDEWLEARIAGAVRAEDDLEGAVEALDEDRPVVVVCANGKRSDEVADDLRERGFQAATIKQGMRGWMRSKLQTLPREAEEFKGPG